MTSTTNADFGAKTDATTVASTFPSSIKNRTILITGVNKQGLGFATASALASQSPATLILSGRSSAKLQECIQALQSEYATLDVRPLVLDLSSQASVRRAAAEVLSWEDVPKIDVVINNAGIMNLPERTLSEDDLEMHLATNHIGHFLLTNLLMPKIVAAAQVKDAKPGDVRIVNVSSMGIMVTGFRFSDPNWTKPGSQLPEAERPNYAMLNQFGLPGDETMTYLPMGAYGQSKTANLLFSIALTSKLYEKHGILSLALHPGEIYTELHRSTDPEWLKRADELREANGMGDRKTPEQGASTTLVAALDPKLGRPGGDGRGSFLADCQISGMPPGDRVDRGLAQKLWEMSERWVGEKFVA